MSSLLVLLVLLSVATLASRRGSFDELVSSAATPLLVGLGAALAPGGLGFLPPSVLQGLGPAVDVGVLWLAMLAGVRASATLRETGVVPRAAMASVVTALVGALVTAGILGLSAALGLPLLAEEHVLATAIVVGAALACLPADAATREGTASFRAAHAAVAELAAFVAAVVVLAAWSGGLRAGAAVGVGVLGAAVARLLAAQTGLAPVVAVLAAGMLAGGLSALALLPGAIVGFAAGALLGRMRTLASLSSWLHASERPVRVVVTVVVAASAGIGLWHVATGAALGLCAVAVLIVTNLLPIDGTPHFERLAASVAMSTTPIVVVVSFAHAGSPPAEELLPVILVAVAVADAVAFILSFVSRGTRRRGAS